MSKEFESIFARLRAILQKHAGTLMVVQDTPACFCVGGGLHPTHRKPFPIASVQMGKAYVSYHLMPIYCCPQLLDGLSAKLKARKQGKSCFNFKVSDEELFKELEQLTAKGFVTFKKTRFMPEGAAGCTSAKSVGV